MLRGKLALATVAVADLEAAERFYTQTLGLEISGREGKEAISFKTGGSDLLVYRSEFAGSNRATAVTWIVGEALEEIVKDLEAKGVRFQHYDAPGMSRSGHVHAADELRVAWFKDSEGNIHSLVTG